MRIRSEHHADHKRPLTLPPWLLSLGLTLILVTVSIGSAQPGSSFVQVVGSLTRDVVGAAGETVDQTIRVQNTGSEPAYINVYFEDVVFSDEGRAYSSDGSHARSGLAWLAGPADPVLVPGGQTVEVPFRLSIPADASGAYWAAIIVRPEEYVQQNWTINDRTSVPVQVVAQYAGVVFASVSGTGRNVIVFDTASVVSTEAGKAVELRVRNDGDRADIFQVRAQLMSDHGELVHAQAIRARIVGGLERTLAIPLGETPPGDYTIIFTADAGQTQLFARQYRVTVP